jgi:rubrerythrin
MVVEANSVEEARKEVASDMRNGLISRDAVTWEKENDEMGSFEIEEGDMGENTDFEDRDRFHNFYHCVKCGEEWDDYWYSQCDDHCPLCNAEMTPYESIEQE